MEIVVKRIIVRRREGYGQGVMVHVIIVQGIILRGEIVKGVMVHEDNFLRGNGS